MGKTRFQETLVLQTRRCGALKIFCKGRHNGFQKRFKMARPLSAGARAGMYAARHRPPDAEASAARLNMSVKDTIADKLKSALAPVSLEVIDESHQHAGHMLHPGGVEPRGETHFRVKVASQAFVGKSRIERHRIINGLLAQELANGVHALAIVARTPDE